MVKSKDQIITDLLNREGGYVNDPADPGGATNFGITQYAWDEYFRRVTGSTPLSVKSITASTARVYYEGEYWNYYSWLPTFDLIDFTIDTAVNHGKPRVNKWIQHSVHVVEDGVIGPKTKAAVIGLLAHHDWDILREDLIIARIREYGRLITQMPSLAKFAAGWMNRVTGFMVTT